MIRHAPWKILLLGAGPARSRMRGLRASIGGNERRPKPLRVFATGGGPDAANSLQTASDGGGSRACVKSCG